jgi:hypothetical protein
MVHVFCPYNDCKRMTHLDNNEYWNFIGKMKCSQCQRELLLEIKDGKLVSAVIA